MRRSLAVVALGLALVLAGCQRSPEAPPASEAPGAVDHVAEAKKALAIADWAAAAPHLRAALQQDPASLFLHYNLAICATWLDQRDEAVREFQWVLDHAPSDSEEASTARKWLAKTGKSTETASAPPAADNPYVGDSRIHGIVTWGGPPVPQNRTQVMLIGLPDSPTKEVRRVVRSDKDGAYEFTKVPAGPYKVEVLLQMKPRWRLKATVDPGQDVVLDLSPDNSFPARDDFPPTK